MAFIKGFEKEAAGIRTKLRKIIPGLGKWDLETSYSKHTLKNLEKQNIGNEAFQHVFQQQLREIENKVPPSKSMWLPKMEKDLEQSEKLMRRDREMENRYARLRKKK